MTRPPLKLPPRTDTMYHDELMRMKLRSTDLEQDGTNVRLIYLVDGGIDCQVLPAQMSTACACGCPREAEHLHVRHWDEDQPHYASRACKQRAWRNALRARAAAADVLMVEHFAAIATVRQEVEQLAAELVRAEAARSRAEVERNSYMAAVAEVHADANALAAQVEALTHQLAAAELVRAALVTDIMEESR